MAEEETETGVIAAIGVIGVIEADVVMAEAEIVAEVDMKVVPSS